MHYIYYTLSLFEYSNFWGQFLKKMSGRFLSRYRSKSRSLKHFRSQVPCSLSEVRVRSDLWRLKNRPRKSVFKIMRPFLTRFIRPSRSIQKRPKIRTTFDDVSRQVWQISCLHFFSLAQVLSVTLRKERPDEKWGFGITGGKDVGLTARIEKVQTVCVRLRVARCLM